MQLGPGTASLACTRLIVSFALFNANPKPCPRINMTTKSPSQKQVIILISQNNTNTIANKTDKHIFNINRLLKSIKSNTIANFLQLDNKSIIVTLNQVASLSDMNIIDRYIRGTDDINSSDIAPTHFPQSKSYLKILGIPYITNSASPIIYNQIEEIIKVTQLFNNITLMSQPCIIKASPKSDMAVI